jgi:hypothetical protein
LGFAPIHLVNCGLIPLAGCQFEICTVKFCFDGTEMLALPIGGPGEKFCAGFKLEGHILKLEDSEKCKDK